MLKNNSDITCGIAGVTIANNDVTSDDLDMVLTPQQLTEVEVSTSQDINNEGYKTKSHPISDPKYLPRDQTKTEWSAYENQNRSASVDFINSSVRKHIKFDFVVFTTFIAFFF